MLEGEDGCVCEVVMRVGVDSYYYVTGWHGGKWKQVGGGWGVSATRITSLSSTRHVRYDTSRVGTTGPIPLKVTIYR